MSITWITAANRPRIFEILMALTVANGGVNRDNPEPTQFVIPGRFDGDLDSMEARIEHLTNEEIDTLVDGEETEQLEIAGRSPELTRLHELLTAVFEREIDHQPHWRCFHCGQVFFEQAAAAQHFGSGNYEGEQPVCIEAATTELTALVLTNREMWERLQKVEADLEQAEFERDCWAQAGRKAVGDPYASWHDIGHIREDADGRVMAAESAINAAPAWLAQLLRRRAERLWRASL